jgi:Rrf2 family cysteine metabolism transcriptional repressor
MISTRCHYALLAVLELARREGSGLVTIAQIAKARRIPERFLEAILLQLKQHGIAHSVRGKAGGYTLARPAAEITVTEVIRIFDHDAIKLAPPPIGGHNRHARQMNVFADLWKEAEHCLIGTLDQADFHGLAIREARADAHQIPDFVI